MRLELDGIEVACSSTDRVVFPDAGLTKGDIIGYYRDLGGSILGELRGRPVTLERFNKGIARGGYFQKHAPKYFPDWIERVAVRGKTEVAHAVVNKLADLVYMANQNTLTFHIPTCRSDHLDAPDRIIFDLDPPPGRFDLVVEAAWVIRDRCSELGLTAFCKTSGSKGLHVVAPLDGSVAYRQVSGFAHRVSEQLAARHADRFTTEFYKKDRGERLYLDAARNHPGATAASAYSVRARPGGPVSAPVAWDEVGPELRPDGFRVPDMPERLERIGDLWAEMDDFAAPLGPAIEALERG